MKQSLYILMLLPMFFISIHLQGQNAEAYNSNASQIEQIPFSPSMPEYFYTNYDDNGILAEDRNQNDSFAGAFKIIASKPLISSGKIQLVPEDYNNLSVGISLYNPLFPLYSNTSLDTVVQLNVVNVFGFYFDLVSANPDSLNGVEKISKEQRENYATLNTYIFIPDDFERNYGRPYYEIFNLPENFYMGFNLYNLRNNITLNSFTLPLSGITSLMILGSDAAGVMNVKGSFNSLRISQR